LLCLDGRSYVALIEEVEALAVLGRASVKCSGVRGGRSSALSECFTVDVEQ